MKHKSFVVIYWHYARNDRAGYTNLTAVVHKLEKDIGIIEKLGDYNVSASINLQRQCRLRKKLTKSNFMLNKYIGYATCYIIGEEQSTGIAG